MIGSHAAGALLSEGCLKEEAAEITCGSYSENHPNLLLFVQWIGISY